MSYQYERDQFMVRCQLSADTARALLRHATTLQRLAEAQCNGDWPADNGQRATEECPLCGSHWVPSQIQGGTAAKLALDRVLNPEHSEDAKREYRRNPRACPDCRTEARVHALLEGTQWQAWTQGDPRGYVLRLFPRTVPGCTECGEKGNRAGASVYHKKGCSVVDGNMSLPVTRDDMHCGRVDALGVPTR